jgi:nucleoside-diphosphate-sugar epimerase
MKALVTGASGFLGSHIVTECLARGDSIRVLVRPSSDLRFLEALAGVEVVYGDLTSAESLERAARGMDVIVHSAARVSDYGSRADFHAANVAGTARLLDAASRTDVRRFVFVSSPSVVMDGNDQVGIDEATPYPSRYLNLYSETKAEAERLVLERNGERLVTCAIRPRGIWGPRDKTGWLPKIVAKMQTGRMPNLSGGRTVHASLCYCENAALACVLAARSEAVGGKAYFVTDAEVTDVWRFADVVAELFALPRIERRLSPRALGLAVALSEAVWSVPYVAKRYSPPLSRYAVALLTRTGTYDIAAARRDFGYAPRVSQTDGLARLKAWVDTIGGVPELVRHVR